MLGVAVGMQHAANWTRGLQVSPRRRPTTAVACMRPTTNRSPAPVTDAMAAPPMSCLVRSRSSRITAARGGRGRGARRSAAWRWGVWRPGGVESIAINTGAPTRHHGGRAKGSKEGNLHREGVAELGGAVGPPWRARGRPAHLGALARPRPSPRRLTMKDIQLRWKERWWGRLKDQILSTFDLFSLSTGTGKRGASTNDAAWSMLAVGDPLATLALASACALSSAMAAGGGGWVCRAAGRGAGELSAGRGGAAGSSCGGGGQRRRCMRAPSSMQPAAGCAAGSQLRPAVQARACQQECWAMP